MQIFQFSFLFLLIATCYKSNSVMGLSARFTFIAFNIAKTSDAPKLSSAQLGSGSSRRPFSLAQLVQIFGQLSSKKLAQTSYSQFLTFFFRDKKSLERFTEGNFEFGASASAALISEGANASADYSDGVAVLTFCS